MFRLVKDLDQQELTDNTKDGRCTCCGECCSNMIALTRTDVARIRRYMKAHNITAPEDHTKAYGVLKANPNKTLDLTCPFLVIKKLGAACGKQEASCRIYPVRPAVCRAFTCEIASDDSKTEQIQEALMRDLTPDEVMQLAKTAPVSMRAVVCGK